MNSTDELYFENLQEFVFDEKKIVTYKSFAVTLNVHVNISKQMLYTFHTQEKQKGREIYATYFLSGYAPANTFGSKKSVARDEDRGIHDEHFVLLCACDKLEETKSKFTKLLSVHVYAVSSTPVKDVHDLRSSWSDILQNSTKVIQVFKSRSPDEYLVENASSSRKRSMADVTKSPEADKKPNVVDKKDFKRTPSLKKEKKNDDVKPQQNLFSSTDSSSTSSKNTKNQSNRDMIPPISNGVSKKEKKTDASSSKKCKQQSIMNFFHKK